jgi:arylsulfatase A-like enzyme
MGCRCPRLALVVPLAAVVSTIVACGGGAREHVRLLPDTITSDDVVAEIGTQLGRVTRHPLGEAPRIEGVQPARARGRRVAILAPVPSRIEYDVHVPAGGLLRVGTAIVEGAGPARERVLATTRFRVRVDDGVVWERVVDPTRRPVPSRHWIDAEIDLGRFADRDVVVALETNCPAGTLTGVTPAWSRIQVLRRTVARRQQATRAAPNVVLLVVDTLRADRLGSYGASPTNTPNLDRLAATGTVFRNTWAQAPWTLPSVTTILTGRYPRAHGVVGRSAGFGRPAGLAAGETNWAYLPDSIPTIASTVRRAGITTVGVTSNLLISRENNLAKGFETFVELPVSPMPVQWARAAAVRTAFTDWLAVNGGRRFFAYLHYMEPHDPYVPSPELRRRCPEGAPAEVCDGVVRNLARERERTGAPLDDATVRYLKSLYDGEVQAWDADLPKLTRALDRLGLLERTVIVMTADHGEEFAEHGQLGHRKQVFAESLAVPLIIVGPGVPVGVRRDLVELVDVLPTILGLLGDPGAVEDIPGHDLMQGETHREHTFAETRYGVIPGRQGPVELLGVRDGRWAYQRAPAVPYERLHDLRQDPGEHHDVSGAQSAVCGTYRSALERWIARTKPPASAPTMAEGITDKLRTLGYVE